MHIWVDADACPRPIKDMLFRAAERRGVAVTLVANQRLVVPPIAGVKSIRVEGGLDAADNYIAAAVVAGDLVITADIPLAAAAIEKQAFALNPRGALYTKENIGERLAVRDMLDELRGSGNQVGGGPPAFHARDRQAFANQLDRLLARVQRA